MGRLLQASGIALLSLVFLGACGDNDSTPDAGGDIDAPVMLDGGEPDATSADAAPPDANLCPVPAPGEPGGECEMDSDCDSAAGGDGICLRGLFGGEGAIRWPDTGYCSRACTDGSNCGADTSCTDIGGGFTACLPDCCTGSVCSPGQLCSSEFFGAPLATDACLPGNPNAGDGDPCDTFGDCYLGSICRNTLLEEPGGQCFTVNCEIGNDSTCSPNGDGQCVAGVDTPFDFSGANLCVDVCSSDADCREAEGYECFDNGNGLMFCRHPEAGDPCTAATDCGNAPPWTCLTGAEFPDGYCTTMGCNPTTGAGCSGLSSACYDPDEPGNPDGDEFCVDRCDLEAANTCRTGYACVEVRQDINGDPVGGCIPTP